MEAGNAFFGTSVTDVNLAALAALRFSGILCARLGSRLSIAKAEKLFGQMSRAMQWHGTIVPMPAYHASGVPATLADASFEGVTPRFSPDPEMEVGEVRQQLETMAFSPTRGKEMEVGEVRQQLETMAFSPTRGIRTDEHAGADTAMGEALLAADTSGLPTLASGSVSSLGGTFSGLQYHCRLRVLSSLASVVSVDRGSAAAVRPRWGANARRTA
ncbi:MAG: hypothetical protein AN485_23200, partial [Anabaena sp. MDT14b]